MEHPIYRDELNKMNSDYSKNIVSSNITLIFGLMKIITNKSNRQKGYITQMSRGKDPVKTLDVLQVLKNVMLDNEYFMEEIIIEKYQLLIKYIKLIEENLDNIIRSNPNVIYDEDDDESTDPLINCDMLSNTMFLVTELIELIKQTMTKDNQTKV